MGINIDRIHRAGFDADTFCPRKVCLPFPFSILRRSNESRIVLDLDLDYG
jgi:hypothetical protein